jgi:hypothetical protein
MILALAHVTRFFHTFGRFVSMLNFNNVNKFIKVPINFLMSLNLLQDVCPVESHERGVLARPRRARLAAHDGCEGRGGRSIPVIACGWLWREGCGQ